MKLILSLILLITVLGCSGDKVYTKSDMWKMGKTVAEDLELIIPKDIESGVQCSNYGPGCISGVTAKVYKLDLIFVEFDSEEHAWQEAKRINGYFARNWVIDDVMGEPILEKFVKKAFKARAANQTKEEDLENH